MKNPLNKRILRELKGDFGKYVVIFLFMLLLISSISGFLVADHSIADAYNKGFDKYSIEDGHMAFNQELPKAVREKLEDATGFTLYDLSYFEETIEGTEKNVRIYKNRKSIDKICLMSGELPVNDNEIALDRMFAQNNGYSIGDTIKLGKKEVTITGLVALPDYSCLFENNSDMMFDSINFCVAIMSEEGYESFPSSHMTYNYGWLYPEIIERADKVTASEKSEEVIDALEDVIKEYDDMIIDETVSAAKMIMLSESLDEIEQNLQSFGMEISLYDNDEGYEKLLDMINSVIEKEGIDLSQELSEGEREVALSADDVKSAMKLNEKELDAAKELIDTVDDRLITVENYVPRYQNQAINFPGDDMGKDKAMILVFGYIVIAVLSFIFAVISTNTITKESTVIGTLRASGYTRGEIMRHYLVLPVIVTVIGAIIGNILGYSFFKDYMAGLYYNSYSLTTYVTLWNAEAFIDTTVVPIILMFVINLFVLNRKLKLSPLRFLRRDLSKRGKKKAFRLNTRISIMNRFRLRVIFQNIFDYVILFIGVFIGGVLVVFGLMLPPLLDDYSAQVIETRICDYQYILSDKTDTDSDQAEKFALTSLETSEKDLVKDEVSVYGVEDNSTYIEKEIPKDKVLISNGYSMKYGLDEGDVFVLKNGTNSDTYEFVVGGVYTYDAAISVFMSIDTYRETFDQESDYFTGYFSNDKLTDIDDKNVATIITVHDLTKLTDQLRVSMGDFMNVITYFGVIMFMLLMYILSKQIIEKNAQSISMTKILGYKNGEIASIYIVSTSIIVVLSLIVSVPVIKVMINYLFKEMIYTMMSGYIPCTISNGCFVKMFIYGMAAYAFISVIQYVKINKIPKADALKNVE